MVSCSEQLKVQEWCKYDDHDKANILQEQFCSIFTNEPQGDVPEFESRTDKLIENLLITKEMVYKEISKLEPSKSCGPDEIHPKMLIELRDFISEPLAVIMNRTLSDECVPDDWKLAYVSPIYKNKGARNLSVNFRPVSLTSILCKLMESILRSHIMKHLINENQYGFVSQLSLSY